MLILAIGMLTIFGVVGMWHNEYRAIKRINDQPKDLTKSYIELVRIKNRKEVDKVS